MPRRSKTAPRTRKTPQQKRRRFRGKYKSKVPPTVSTANGRIVLMLPRRLRSLNDRGGWRSEHGERQAWDALVCQAETLADWPGPQGACYSPWPVSDRRRLEILRLAPNKRYLLDTENLAYCAKRLTDTLVDRGYLVDDNEMWVDGPVMTQGVSADKCYWAIVTISPADAYYEDFTVISPAEEVHRRLKANIRGKQWTRTPSELCGVPETTKSKPRTVSSRNATRYFPSRSTSQPRRITASAPATTARTTKTRPAGTA